MHVAIWHKLAACWRMFKSCLCASRRKTPIGLAYPHLVGLLVGAISSVRCIEYLRNTEVAVACNNKRVIAESVLLLAVLLAGLPVRELHHTHRCYQGDRLQLHLLGELLDQEDCLRVEA